MTDTEQEVFEELALSKTLKESGAKGFAFMLATLKLCNLGYKLTPDVKSENALKYVNYVWHKEMEVQHAIAEWERSVIAFYKGKDNENSKAKRISV